MRELTLFFIFLPLFYCGCEFKTPPGHEVTLLAEEVLHNLPFSSGFTSALAWHPDGAQLAVAEHAGAVNSLRSVTLSDPHIQDLGMRFRTRRRFAAIAQRGLIVSETEAGQLQAQLLHSHESTIFFAKKVYPRLWSLSSAGEDLVYVPIPNFREPFQVRHVALARQEERVIVDSLQTVLAVSILPQGNGVWIASTVREGGLIQVQVALYSLPDAEPLKTLTFDPSPLRLAASPDGKRLAYSRNLGNHYELVLYDPEYGLLDRLISVPRPVSDLVWLHGGEWLALFVEKEQGGFGTRDCELRAYHVRLHHSVVLAPNLAFTTAEGFAKELLLFAIADTLAFLTSSRERISIFRQSDYSFRTVFEAEEDNEIQTLAWEAGGTRLFWHERTRNGQSVLYWGANGGWERSARSETYDDVSLLPDRQYLLGLNGNALVKIDFTSALSETLWYSQQDLRIVDVHPDGALAAIVERTYDAQSGELYPTLRVFDLISNAMADSIRLPGQFPGAFDWLQTHDHRLAAIWQSDREGWWPGSVAYESYYLSLAQRRWLSIFLNEGSAFCVRPHEERVSFVQSNTLRTVQLQTKIP